MNKINRKYLILFAITIMFIGINPVLADEVIKECMQCADAYIPANLVAFSARLVGFIQVMVPVVIILTGMIELLRAVIASDEKKMDEAKSNIIRKFIAGIAIFLVFVIVKFAFNLLGSTTANDYINCASCFINEDCADYNVVSCPSRINYNETAPENSSTGGSTGSSSTDSSGTTTSPTDPINSNTAADPKEDCEKNGNTWQPESTNPNGGTCVKPYTPSTQPTNLKKEECEALENIWAPEQNVCVESPKNMVGRNNCESQGKNWVVSNKKYVCK